MKKDTGRMEPKSKRDMDDKPAKKMAKKKCQWKKIAVIKGHTMANQNDTRNNARIREGRDGHYKSHDELIDTAKKSGNYNTRTDAYAEGAGYLGIDDLDKIRRRKLK